MFYPTTIEEITEDGVKDIQGKNLRFAGKLQCQEGDTVWTDGKVILGHMPIRGINLAPPESGGVPVIFTAEDDEGERFLVSGYIKKNGTFKEMPINSDIWITNNAKIFKGGGGTVEGQRVIDAEIFNSDGKLYVATDGFYRQCQAATYKNHLFRVYRRIIREDEAAYGSLAYITPYEGEDVTLGYDLEEINTPVAIYTEGEEKLQKVSEISLEQFAQLAVEKSYTARNSARNSIMSRADVLDEGSVNFFQFPEPPKSFIAMSSARIVAFKILQGGDWAAIVHASASGYCFPYLVRNASVLDATFNDTSGAKKTSSEDLATCLNLVEDSIFNKGYFPFLKIEKYSGSGNAEEKLNYYIPKIKFKYREWYTVGFGASMLFLVHNGEITQTMVEHTFGGNPVFPIQSWDEEKADNALKNTFCLEDNLQTADWEFPISEGYWLRGNGYQIKSICEQGDEENLEAPPFYKGELWTVSSFLWKSTLDSVAEDMIENEGVGINYIWHHDIDLPRAAFDLYRYGEEGRTTDSPQVASNLSVLEPYELVDGIYDPKAFQDSAGNPAGVDDFNRDGFYRLSPLFEKLRGGKVLFGNYSDDLYISGGDGWERFCNGLRNFRLREMKNINKARK